MCSKFYPSTVADLAYYEYATMRQFKNQKKHNSSSIFFFLREFQLMASILDDSSLSLDQDTN